MLDLDSKLGENHINSSGIRVRNLHYNLGLAEVADFSGLKDLVDESGNTFLTNLYFNSTMQLSQKTTMVAGISIPYFALSKEAIVEPRIAITRRLNDRTKIGVAYGKHSRIEPLHYYFIKNDRGQLINHELELTKAHHITGSFQWNIAEKSMLKVEPYYQHLFDIPILEDGYRSLINLDNEWFIDDALANSGKGRNIGVDITWEKYIENGFYGLVTTSIFDSKYKTKLLSWTDTRFNTGFVANVLMGKEFQFGTKKNRFFSINYRMNYQAGAPYTPVDESNSLMTGEILYQESSPYSRRFDHAMVHHFTVNYSVAREKVTHALSLKVINAGGYKEFESFRIHLRDQTIVPYREALVIPNLSYKITF